MEVVGLDKEVEYHVAKLRTGCSNVLGQVSCHLSTTNPTRAATEAAVGVLTTGELELRSDVNKSHL